jgi:uncharacterized protein (DUF427 family)
LKRAARRQAERPSHAERTLATKQETAMNPSPDDIARARSQWLWRGETRPPFAETPGPEQASVWDFPRPPALRPDGRKVVVRWGGMEVARTRGAICLLETSHPPTFYLPWADVDRALLQPAGGGSFCEWKGPAGYWSLVRGGERMERIAWSYPEPLAGAEAIADCVAFYAKGLDCIVGGAPVRPQPGGFYGGWVTPELAGPFKSLPGSGGW